MEVNDESCYICDESINPTCKQIINAVTSHSSTYLVNKLQNFVGKDFIVVVNEDDKLCERCLDLFNQIDKHEFELKQVNCILGDHLKRKYEIRFSNETNDSGKDFYNNTKEFNMEKGTKDCLPKSKQLFKLNNEEVNKIVANKEHFGSIGKVRIVKKCDLKMHLSKNHVLKEVNQETMNEVHGLKITNLEKEALKMCEKDVKAIGNDSLVNINDDKISFKKQIRCSNCNESVNDIYDDDNISFLLCDKCSGQVELNNIQVSLENQTSMEDVMEHLNIQSDVELHDKLIKLNQTIDLLNNNINESNTTSDLMETNEINLESGLSVNKTFDDTLNNSDNQESWYSNSDCKRVGKLCKICNKSFKREAMLLRHIRSKHRDSLFCGICQTPFLNLETLIAHEKEHNKKFECQICCKVLNSRFNLKAHLIRIHTRDYPYVCETCDRGFIHLRALNDHKSLHSAELKYICDICGKGFRLHNSYYKHRILHDNPYPKECDVCHQCFRSSSRLAEHRRRTHTFERPYKCPYCPLSFHVNAILKSHLCIHTKQYPYTCEQCKRGFPSRFKYALHMAKKHKDDSLIKYSNNKEIEEEWLTVSRKD